MTDSLMPEPDRAVATEATTLLSCLNAQRHHILGSLDGLDDDALRRPVLPSGWSMLGLVQHLALDVERFWFRGVVAAEPPVLDWLDRNVDDAWQVGPLVRSESVLDSYRAEIERADKIITASSLDAAPGWWPEGMFGGWRVESVREIVLHVITETACHAGHLDAARELVDNRQWLVLT